MTIKELQRRIEDSLEALQDMDDLPEDLQDLRLLVPPDAAPRVTIRSIDRGRRLRSHASAQDFRPHECEVILNFDSYEKEDYGEERERDFADEADDGPARSEIEELLDALDRAEEARDFVGLKWFRDRFLPEEGYPWAEDRGFSGRLIREATIEKLVLTSHVQNPRYPMQPTTAICINRSHPRFQESSMEPPVETRPAPRPPEAFKPVPLRGRPLSATMREDRR